MAEFGINHLWLSGTNEVPVLELDDGEVVSGSGAIARWAQEHPGQGS